MRYSELTHHQVLRSADAQRYRILGLLTLVAALLPVSLGTTGTMSIWEAISVSPWSESVRLLAPLLLAIGLLVLPSIRALGRLGLGLSLLTLLVVSIVIFTKSQLAYTAVFTGLLDYVGRQPLVVVLGFTLVAVGAECSMRDGLESVRKVLLRLGGFLLLLLYLLPQRGQPFIIELVTSASAFLAVVGGHGIITMLLDWLFALFPLVVGLNAIGVAGRNRTVGLLGAMARYGLPLLAVLLCYRFVTSGFGMDAIFLQLRASILLAVVLGVGSRALEGILLHLLHDPLPTAQEPPSHLARDHQLRKLLRQHLERPQEPPKAHFDPSSVKSMHPLLVWLMQRRIREIDRDLIMPSPAEMLARLEGSGKRSEPPAPASTHRSLWWLSAKQRLNGLFVGLAIISMLGLTWRFARSQPDLTWSLSAATEQADTLLGRQLPRHIVRASRHQSAREDAEANDLTAESAKLQQQRDELIRAAEVVDPELAQHVNALVARLETLDFHGSLWFEAIQPLNQRIRALGLPYYLDGNYFEWSEDGRIKRYFYLVSYRVQSIERYRWDGGDYAALFVTRLDRLNLRDSRLGYVNEREPFALVLVDEIERSVRRQVDHLRQDARCRITSPDQGPYARDIEELCTELMGDLISAQYGLYLNDSPDPIIAKLVEEQRHATALHELQHQVDATAVNIPGELFRLLPVASDIQLLRPAQEASAYLTELATDKPITSLWTLAQLTGFLLRDQGQNPYRYAAAIVIGQLLGKPVMEPMGHVTAKAVYAIWEQAAAHAKDLTAWLKPLAEEAHETLIGSPIAYPIKL